jgi:hypothetical protein
LFSMLAGDAWSKMEMIQLVVRATARSASGVPMLLKAL